MSQDMGDAFSPRDGGDAEIVCLLREAANDVTGANCVFADDDIRLLAGLADRAVKAGLTEGLDRTVLDSIARKYRTGKYASASAVGIAETPGKTHP